MRHLPLCLLQVPRRTNRLALRLRDLRMLLEAGEGDVAEGVRAGEEEAAGQALEEAVVLLRLEQQAVSISTRELTEDHVSATLPQTDGSRKCSLA